MSNYVQVRYAPSSSLSKNISHDLRINKVNYLRSDMFHNKYKNFNSKADVKQLKVTGKSVEQKSKELYKKRVGRNPQAGKASAFNTGIITLSNSINEQLEDGTIKRAELDKLFKNAIKEQLNLIKELTGTKPELLYSSIHYDEKTPHAHFVMTNFDNEGKSIAHQMKDSDRLARCQDTVGESFSSIGFVRGEKKINTNAKHMSVRQMHEEENKELRRELKKLIKQTQEAKKEFKKSSNDKTQLKVELDAVDKVLRETRKNLKDDSATVLSLQSKKTLLEQSIEHLIPTNKKIPTYPPESVIQNSLIETTVPVRVSTFKTEEQTFKELDIPRMTKFIEGQNKVIQDFNNAPLYNQKLKDDLESANKEILAIKAKHAQELQVAKDNIEMLKISQELKEETLSIEEQYEEFNRNKRRNKV